MRLLIDTDAFCKLAIAGIFDEAANLFAAHFSDCLRLPALPYMLRRGRLRRVYGESECNSIIELSESLPAITDDNAEWLEKLTPINEIDPGEAQIFAMAARTKDMVVTGDKRALGALKEIQGFTTALTARIVLLEAILIELCDKMGADELRRHCQKVSKADMMMNVCFSRSNQDLQGALASYFADACRELAPLRLWQPNRSRT